MHISLTVMQDQTPYRRVEATVGTCDEEWPSTSVSFICFQPVKWKFIWLLGSGYFAQHHVDTLNPAMNPVQFLASKYPGKTEQEYRSHLGNFQISGMTG